MPKLHHNGQTIHINRGVKRLVIDVDKVYLHDNGSIASYEGEIEVMFSDGGKQVMRRPEIDAFMLHIFKAISHLKIRT